MALWALAWLAGVALQLQQAALCTAAQQAALAATALVALGLAWRWPRARTLLAAAGLALLGLASTDWRAAQRLAEQLPAALEGQDIQVTGVVARLPQPNLAGTRFVFEVEQAQHQGRAVQLPASLALGWYRGPDADALLLGPGDLRAGQRWRFTVRLRQPHGNLNPLGFDYELWLWEQGLRATGYVRSRAGDLAQKLNDDAGHPVQRLRQRVRDRIQAQVDDASAAGLLAALAIGDQGAIDRADWDLFRVTGVAHLVSISGLHVTMFAWLAGALVGRAWRRSTRAMLWMPTPTAARWGGLLLATAYAVLAGWGVPAQRTVLMIATVVLLRSQGRHWPPPLVLLAAAVAVALLDPWALLQPGFWLSFVAVGLLMLSDPTRAAAPPAGEAWPARLRRTLAGGLRAQAVATVGLTPLSLVFFQQVSVVGVVANLLAIPLVTLVITPLALAGMLLPPLWTVGALVCQLLLQALSLLASLPGAQFSTPAAPLWAGLLGLLGGALLVLPLPLRLRVLGPPLLLPLLWPVVDRPPPGRFELLALDIGQGTAVLLRTQHHLLVYDTGPQYSTDSDAGQRVLLPLLRGRGEERVHLLVLSHRDGDHVGGATSLLKHTPVEALSSSFGATHAQAQRCEAGQRWTWDGVDFELLHPDPAAYAAAGRPNTVSCVLRVSGPQGSALLTGDIERAQELALVDRLGPALKSDLLLVPHHGSKTSSSDTLLDAVAPSVAVVQAGYRSRYGHPAAEVLARYDARRIPVVRTDACGAWAWRADGSMVCQRQLAARYWHHRVRQEP